MSKNILILSSSPRRNGNTEALCDAFTRGATDAGHTVSHIALRDKTIHYCTGCSVCSRDGKPCPQKDDAAAIIEQMISADVIVLSSPVYFYAMSAQLKTLIDRCCGRYGEMHDKEFYMIAAGAEGPEGRPLLEHAFDNMTGFLDCLDRPTLRGRILACGVWHPGEIKGNPALDEAYEAGRTC